MAQTLLFWMPFGKNKLSYDQICQKIHEACRKAGRPEDSVRPLAVTKNQPQEAILPLLELGHRLFGENRVQEAAAKWVSLREQYPDIQLHLIGPLQTNKVAQALEVFDVIETIDRPRLVEALAKAWSDPKRRTTRILIQVNTGQEPQKSGVSLKDLSALVDLCRSHNLPLGGLMCIPPATEDPSPHFQLLGDLAKQHKLPDLSMGMSNDYVLAIAHGATWVRIGTALFPSESKD